MMKLNPSWFLFFLLNLMGSLMVMSSNNWYMAWMGFELSLMGFLPLVKTGSLSVESMIKYFLIQAGASSMFLFSFLMTFSCMGSAMILYAMIMKLGIFPFYHWMPSVMKGMSWLSCLILTTIQKLGPLFMIFSLDLNLQVIQILVISSASILLGSLMAYNQSLMRGLMAYSSISHNGWLLSVSFLNIKFSMIYLLLYFTMSGLLFKILHQLKILKVIINKNISKNLFYINIMLLALAGIPPFPIFFLKLLIFKSMLPYLPMIIIMVLSAVISVYFYLTFVIASLSNKNNTLSYTSSIKSTFFTLFIFIISTMFLML